jgi:hypothetical protein
MVAKSLMEKREYVVHHQEKGSLYLFVLTGLFTPDFIKIVKEAKYGRRKRAMPSVEVALVQ